MRWLVLLFLSASLARAGDDRAGDFDYYILSLSWSPTWCALEGAARNSPQCERPGLGWVLHGLWPQYETGWPSDCRTPARDPSRRMTAAMADIMGTSGLAWYQWKKHGRCSGLSAADYFASARRAYDSLTRPEVFHRLDRTVKLPANVVEEAFLKENPTLRDEMITPTCKAGYIQEIRICLTKNLSPRPCGRDVARDCTLDNARMDPVR
ncbi:ribonuclease T2 [Rhodovulum imhoffii]|uniref:Ribonuclease T2 n=1 Tax=Rhodovulum imhoffii TaxID=365340 RepID=A0A2T5BUA4_9RHOB|nr:ribonuclease T2 [Rhodovulum imhoffii]MBK5934529.1 ribonuclease T [Rhodovulum imhoffii]PTN03054.1 ribonuclease T2 [Rhodovulum imhoffii]